jgi:NitT/TauT family transport system substrate-binding protein
MIPAVVALTVCLAVGFASAKDLTEVSFVQAHSAIGLGEDVFLYGVPQAMGWFVGEGLEVSIDGVRGGTLAAQILQSGKVQFASTAPEIVMSVREKGGDLKIFMALRRQGGYAIAVLADNDSINTIKDLKGKSFGAASLASGAVPIVKGMMNDLGYSEQEYSILAAGTGGQGATAIATGKVDALALWDAAYAVIENKGVKLKYLDFPVIPKLAGFSVATTDRFMKENPEAVIGIGRAIAKGVVFSKANPTAAVKLFYEVFPQTKPNPMTEEAVKGHVNILKKWMSNGTGSDPNVPIGWNYPWKWEFSYKYYQDNGRLKAPKPLAEHYTNDLIKKINDFDVKAIEDQAKAMK